MITYAQHTLVQLVPGCQEEVQWQHARRIFKGAHRSCDMLELQTIVLRPKNRKPGSTRPLLGVEWFVLTKQFGPWPQQVWKHVVCFKFMTKSAAVSCFFPCSDDHLGTAKNSYWDRGRSQWPKRHWNLEELVEGIHTHTHSPSLSTRHVDAIALGKCT